jgi:hypothetical protein
VKITLKDTRWTPLSRQIFLEYKVIVAVMRGRGLGRGRLTSYAYVDILPRSIFQTAFL